MSRELKILSTLKAHQSKFFAQIISLPFTTCLFLFFFVWNMMILDEVWDLFITSKEILITIGGKEIKKWDLRTLKIKAYTKFDKSLSKIQTLWRMIFFLRRKSPRSGSLKRWKTDICWYKSSWYWHLEGKELRASCKITKCTYKYHFLHFWNYRIC